MFVSSTFHNSNNKRFSVSIKKTFDKIKHVADLRQSLSPGSKERFTDVFHNIPEELEQNQSYHRQCYSKFTNCVKQLTSGDDKTQGTQRTSIRTPQHFLSKKCVFCQKEGPQYLNRNGVWVKETCIASLLEQKIFCSKHSKRMMSVLSKELMAMAI